MGANPATKYTDEFRRETADYDISSGRPITECCRELGLNSKTVNQWVINRRRELSGEPDPKAEDRELREARRRPGGHPPCPHRPAKWSARRRKEGPEMQCSRRHASSDAVLPSTPASQSSRLKNSCFSSVAPARRRPSEVSRTSRPATSTSDRDERPASALVTLGLVTPRRSVMSTLRHHPRSLRITRMASR